MEKYDIKFKKKYGQNFLKDSGIVERIVDVTFLDKDSLVIEVGPGGGIMTRELAKRAGKVIAYEVDDSLKVELFKRVGEFDNVEVFFKNFLDADILSDISKYGYEKVYFISNVPYYITTPIINKLIESGIKYEKIVMMVQKEVGERFCASSGTKDYGAITVLLNYHFKPRLEFLVKRENFVPVPNVDSAIVSFSEIKKQKLEDYAFFKNFVFACFKFKRKNLKNNLKGYDLNLVESILEKYGYNLTVRAEALDVDIFVELSNQLCKKS